MELARSTAAAAANMADVQDDDQWLYGDDKDDSKEEGEINEKTTNDTQKTAQVYCESSHVLVEMLRLDIKYSGGGV